MWKWLCLVAITCLGSAQAAPTVQLDFSGQRVVSIFDLYDDPTCTPRPLRMKVVKHQFGQDAVTVENFVIELPDGVREFVGVDVDMQNLSLNASGWLIRGLHTLLADGHEVEVIIKFCGASGHSLMLDAVREVPPWEH